MNARRARYWLAMGLPLSACENEPVHQPDPVTTAPPTATATASATATVTASANPVATNTTPTATATPVPPTPTPTATIAPPTRGLASVPHFSAEYAFANHRGCNTANAHCYMLSDLQKQASAGATCPLHEDVPQGCMGGAVCADPDARTQGDLLTAVSRGQTTAKHASACCYTVPDLCCAGCGRTLRDGEHVVVTPSRFSSTDDWTADVRVTRKDAAKARRFEVMASAEHASIASFAQTTLDLLALGAPAELVARTQAAALDEIEHARFCYALASKLSGAIVGPDKLDVKPRASAATFASFAVATFVDACIGETLGVDLVRDLAARETDPEIAAGLERIADDEERHAELAFSTLAWAVRAGGDAARDAIRDACRNLDAVTRARAVVRDVVLPCTNALVGMA